MISDNIPREMQHFESWVCWKYEDRGDAKPTKVPYDAKNGRLASVTNPATWSSFTIANSLNGYYDGIGLFYPKTIRFA